MYNFSVGEIPGLSGVVKPVPLSFRRIFWGGGDHSGAELTGSSGVFADLYAVRANQGGDFRRSFCNVSYV